MTEMITSTACSVTRTRRSGHVSRVRYAPDTDTPRIRRRYVSAEYRDKNEWKINGYAGRTRIWTFLDTAQPTKHSSSVGLARHGSQQPALDGSTQTSARPPAAHERRRSPSPATSRRPPARRTVGCNLR